MALKEINKRENEEDEVKKRKANKEMFFFKIR
jgi:hypothetical protein